MVWIVIEALIALFVLLGIMGWTLHARRPDDLVDEGAISEDADPATPGAHGAPDPAAHEGR